MNTQPQKSATIAQEAFARFQRHSQQDKKRGSQEALTATEWLEHYGEDYGEAARDSHFLAEFWHLVAEKEAQA